VHSEPRFYNRGEKAAREEVKGRKKPRYSKLFYHDHSIVLRGVGGAREFALNDGVHTGRKETGLFLH